VTPLVLLPGRRAEGGSGVRGPSYASGRRYADAIHRAGAIALQVPPLAFDDAAVEQLVARADAVVLHGGGDVDPARYGATSAHETLYGVDPVLDGVEIAIVRAAVARDLPVLAICRGAQVLNVALGGTLVQDLGEVLEDRESHWDRQHDVEVTAGSRTARALGRAPYRCHSYHHQAIDRVATGLVVTARAPDGVIEAVEHERARWVVGVQWHPEDDADSDPAQQGLFDAVVDAARA
jgi:putative glutamine amidotransferase